MQHKLDREIGKPCPKAVFISQQLYYMYEEIQAEPAIFTVKIQPNSSLCGIHLSAIAPPEKCALLGLLRDHHIIPLSQDPAVYADDYVLAIALHPMMVPALKVTLKRTHPVSYSLQDCLIESSSDFYYPSNRFHPTEIFTSKQHFSSFLN